MDIVKITGRKNPLIVNTAKLHMKKYRDEEGLVILEGERLIRDAMSRKVEIKHIFCLNEVKAAWQDLCRAYEVVYVLNEVAFDALSVTEHSQGICAVAKYDTSAFHMPTAKFLVLDRVRDPGNMGGIIRTAAASGFREIYCRDCVDVKNSKVLRACMGTVFTCDIMNVEITELAQVARSNVLVCASMQGEDLFKFRPPDSNFGVVMGNEANGVTREVAELCERFVSIPMQNNVESLNVAVACGVILYQLSH